MIPSCSSSFSFFVVRLVTGLSRFISINDNNNENVMMINMSFYAKSTHLYQHQQQRSYDSYYEHVCQINWPIRRGWAKGKSAQWVLQGGYWVDKSFHIFLGRMMMMMMGMVLMMMTMKPLMMLLMMTIMMMMVVMMVMMRMKPLTTSKLDLLSKRFLLPRLAWCVSIKLFLVCYFFFLLCYF